MLCAKCYEAPVFQHASKSQPTKALWLPVQKDKPTAPTSHAMCQELAKAYHQCAIYFHTTVYSAVEEIAT